MNDKNLVIARKAKGRQHEYNGQDFQDPWKLKDLTTGKLYADYDEYVADTKPTPVAKKVETKAKTAPAKK